MEFLITQALNGLVYGSLLFLLAAGLSLIFGLMNVVNVTHGSFYMLGAFFGCRLWEFGLGMVIGTWYWHDRARVDARVLSPGGFAAGVAIYTAGLYSYDYGLAYTMTDGLIGTGLFLILAQLAWQSRRFACAEAAIAYVGVFSYGFYLVHQPYVIYFGSRLREFTLTEFAIAALPLIALLAFSASWFERAVNAIFDRILEGPKRGAASGAKTVRVASGS